MRKCICKILTLGRHWWQYYPEQGRYVRCRLCGKTPDSMWGEFTAMLDKKKDQGRWIDERRKSLGLPLLLIKSPNFSCSTAGFKIFDGAEIGKGSIAKSNSGREKGK
jgi:hypothetical protein